jgi:plastocyanin
MVFISSGKTDFDAILVGTVINLLNCNPKYMLSMKKMRINVVLLTGLLLAGVYSCSKDTVDYNAQGGLLPTNYIMINDASFSPNIITVAAGSSITFVNNTNTDHSIVSDDSTTILSGTIQSGTSSFFKKDTIGTFRYHCGVHPTVRGVIYLRP